MAYMCARGWGKECNGCMRCRYTDVEGECYSCGATVHIYDDFEYIANKLYCEECANEFHEEEEEE